MRAARLRLTVDGHGEEFWLLGFPPTFDDKSTQPEALRFVEGRGRTVSVKMPLDRIDVGFQMKLRDFERTLARNVRAALADIAAGRPVQIAETTPYGCGVKYAD